jgi:predicted RNA-binding protein YlxR (DUF448 family)
VSEPIRSCIGCRRKATQDELTRVARRPDGSLGIGRTLHGRGAWLCTGSLQCFELAVRRKAFSKALRGAVDERDIERLRTEFMRSGPAARD